MTRQLTLSSLDRIAIVEAEKQWGKIAQPMLPAADRLRGKTWKISYDDSMTESYFGKEEKGKTVRTIKIEKIYLYYDRIYIDAWRNIRNAIRTFSESGIYSIVDSAGFSYRSIRDLLSDECYGISITQPEHYRMGIHPQSWSYLRPFAVICKSIGRFDSVFRDNCYSCFSVFANWRLSTSHYSRFNEQIQFNSARRMYCDLILISGEIDMSIQWVERRASPAQKAKFVDCIMQASLHDAKGPIARRIAQVWLPHYRA